MPRRNSQGDYDACKDRSIGHDWFITDVEKRSSFGTPVWHMCGRCGTIRKRILDNRGRIAAQYYKHPGDYKYDFDPGIYRLFELTQYRAAQREVSQRKGTKK